MQIVREGGANNLVATGFFGTNTEQEGVDIIGK
jgi:hypothetical protein